MKRAFTLIELLVVIAIVAILAAILFPVFAQAKLAAKKSVDLSNLKQTNLATTMYAGDHDDRYPINSSGDGNGGYLWGWVQDLPWDLRGGQAPLYYEQNQVTWGNSVQPYLKNLDLLGSPVRKTIWPESFGDQRSQWVKRPGSASYAFNGLLEQWSATAVARPSQLISFSQPLGGTAFEGGNFAQPYLFCPEANKACVYVPTKGDCSGARNGEISGTWWYPEWGANLRAAFGNGSNFAYADGSAKFRRMAANVNGKTDFRSDSYTEYDAQGNAALSWYDDAYCHPLLFRPDFEFQDWGSPVEGV